MSKITEITHTPNFWASGNKLQTPKKHDDRGTGFYRGGSV